MDGPTFQKVLNAQNISIQLQIDHWLKYEVFSLQFWLLMSLLILPWFIWFKLVDRKRLMVIMVYGLLISTVATILDELGCQLNLWEYIYDIEPLFPRLIPMNLCILPIGYMLIYQYFVKWKSFIPASLVLAAFYSFVGEPLLQALKIYIMLNWKAIYSFPIYFLLAIIFKVLLNWIISKQKEAQASL